MNRGGSAASLPWRKGDDPEFASVILFLQAWLQWGPRINDLILSFSGRMLLTSCFLYGLTSIAHATPLKVVPNNQGLPLGHYLEYTPALDGESIDDLLLRETRNPAAWEQNPGKIPNLGYQKNSYWFRFTLDFREQYSALPQHFIFEVTYPPLDRIEFYSPSGEQGKFAVTVSGDMLPVTSRLYFHRNFTFATSLPAKLENALATYYMKVQTDSSLQLPVTLWTQQSFIDEMGNSSYIFGIFYGVMGVMVLYNLFLFLSIRDRSYIYYVIYIMTYMLFQFTLNGYSIMYLWPGISSWNNMSLPLLITASTATAALFTRKFLSLKETSRRTYYLTTAYIIILGTILIAEIFLPYVLAIKIAIMSAIPAVIMIIGSGIVSWRAGFSPAKYFLIAWLGMAIGTLLILLKSLGLVGTTVLTTYAQQIGSCLEVLLLSLGLGARINEFKKERERMQQDMISSISRTNDAYSRFVPAEFLKFLEKKSILDVQLGDQREHKFTIMFIDIRSFTKLSETMSAKENFDFLNSYLKRISPLINQNGGFIDKYIGDAVMALFPGTPEQALDAAIAIRRELVEYNRHRATQNYQPIKIGIGIHYGNLILGTIGSEERMEGTVISDAVNLASRVEGLTKRFQTPIIFSAAVLENLADELTQRYSLRNLGQVKVKGKTDGVPIYELYSGEDAGQIRLKDQTKELFETACANLTTTRLAKAQRMFEQVLAINAEDQVAQVILNRIKDLGRKNSAAALHT